MRPTAQLALAKFVFLLLFLLLHPSTRFSSAWLPAAARFSQRSILRDASQASILCRIWDKTSIQCHAHALSLNPARLAAPGSALSIAIALQTTGYNQDADNRTATRTRARQRERRGTLRAARGQATAEAALLPYPSTRRHRNPLDQSNNQQPTTNNQHTYPVRILSLYNSRASFVVHTSLFVVNSQFQAPQNCPMLVRSPAAQNLLFALSIGYICIGWPNAGPETPRRPLHAQDASIDTGT